MTRPVRIQLSRKKGFRLQEVSKALNGLPAVNVARPSKWGNPFKTGEDYTITRKTKTCYILNANAKEVAVLYELALMSSKQRKKFRLPEIEEIRRELRGKNLACWCPPGQPCHADVLLEIANDWPDTAFNFAQRGGQP